MASKIKVVGFHLEPESEQKFAELAQAMQRSRSGVIRLLLRQATLAPQPDITLAPIEGLNACGCGTTPAA
jgi:hypothetical protein